MKKLLLSLIVMFVLCLSLVSANVVINEVMPNVGTTDWDNNGVVNENDDEWIELYNNNSIEVNISGWNISDKTQSRYTFPVGTILGPQEHIVVFDLSLVNSDDNVTLYDNLAGVVDNYVWDYDPGNDISITRIHDALEMWINSTTPTLNKTNNIIPNGTIGNKNTNEDTNYFFNISDFITDLDNDDLTFTIVDENVSEVDCEIINLTNVTLSPALNWNGVAECIIEVDDSYEKVNKTFNVIVNAVNDAPLIIGVLNQSATEDINLTLNVTPYIGDVDNSTSSLIITTNSAYATVKDQDIIFNYPNGVLRENLTINVSDGSLVFQQNISIIVSPVNDAPTVSMFTLHPMNEDFAYTINMTNSINDTDNNISELIITENSSYATVNGQIITFNFTNDALTSPSTYIDVMIIVSDGELTAQKNMTAWVTNTNDNPVLDLVGDKTVREGILTTFNLSANDIDPTNDTLTYTTNPLMPGMIISPDGEVNFTPTQSSVGINNVTFIVNDGKSGQDNETITMTVESLLTFSELIVNVDGINYSLNNGDSVPAFPGSEVSLSVKSTNNFEQVSEWVESLKWVGEIASPISDTKTISDNTHLDGTKSVTKTLTFDNLPLTITEGKYALSLNASGKDSNGIDRMVEWVVYIDYITESSEIKIINENTTYDNLSCTRQTKVGANFVNSGETVQNVNVTFENTELGVYELLLLMLPAKSTTPHLSIDVNVPNAIPGTYPISIKGIYSDGAGGYTEVENSVDVVIVPCINIADQFIVEDNTSVNSINITLNTSYDPVKPYYGDNYWFNITEQTNESLINCSIYSWFDMGPMTYKHYFQCTLLEANATGYSDVTISADHNYDDNISYDTIRVSVIPVNDAPVAHTISTINVDEDSSVAIELNCSDVEGDTLDYIIVTEPSNGTLSGSGDSRVYTPDADYNGHDTFTYKCNDGNLDSNDKNVGITINSVLDEASIETSTPVENSLLIGDNVEQLFEITIHDPDNANPIIEWFVDGSSLGPSCLNSLTCYIQMNTAGDYNVKVNITNATTNNEVEWDVSVATTPQSSYSGTINDVNDSNVDNFTGLTVYNGNAKIDFGNQTINLSDVVDMDSNFDLSNGVVGIDSDATGFSVFKNYEATITMYNIDSKNTPIIYYDSGFSTTGTTECSAAKCYDITYSSGTLTFKVSGFSTFFIQVDNSAPGTGVLELDVDVDEDEPKPDENVEINVEIENNGNLDIEDIELEIEIRDSDGDVVEDEDDDDLEDDEDLDLDDGDDDTFDFTFKMPADAQDGDEYTVYVQACGEDDNGVEECVIDESQSITIEREKHEVVSSVSLSPSTLVCYDSFDVSVGVKNIGKKDEDVRVVVKSEELGIYESTEFELEAYDEDDYKNTVSFGFAADSDVKVGTYDVIVEVEYDDEVETKRLTLTKEECLLVEEEEEIVGTLGGIEVSTATLTRPSSEYIEITETPTNLVTGAATTSHNEFINSFEYMIMLIILSILAIGLIIFVIGAMIIKL